MSGVSRVSGLGAFLVVAVVAVSLGGCDALSGITDIFGKYAAMR